MRWIVIRETLFWLVVLAAAAKFAWNCYERQPMASEQDFTVRAYDLGNKPIEASGKHRVRLYSGGRVIKDMLTDITPVISPEGFVFVNGIRVSGTVIVEEVNQ